MSEPKLSYSIKSAAAATDLSVSTIRRAIATTDPDASPPPLTAGVFGGHYLILAADLKSWLEKLLGK